MATMVEEYIALEEFQELEREKMSLESKVDELTADNLYLRNELEKLKRLIFGSKSERFVSNQVDGQLKLELGDLPEVESQPVEMEKVTIERAKKPRQGKKQPLRSPIPAHLPRREEIIEPEGVAPGAKKIGEVVTEVLEYEPGNLYVRKIIRPKYALLDSGGVIIGEIPSLPIPRGNAGPGLLAHILVGKFVDHLPFYRQIGQLKRQGLEIADSTINGWFNKACDLLLPLHDKLVLTLLSANYMMADETPIPVQDSHKAGSTHRGYHWVYYSPTCKLVCFDYQVGRGRDGPVKFLGGFRGTLQTDGYGAYDIFEKWGSITLLACMAHARRKFEQALNNDPERARHALGLFQDLYAVEKEARELGMDHEQRKELRQERSVPLLNKMEDWLKTEIQGLLPKSAIGTAMSYTLGLWKRLTRYVDDGRYEIDNNLIENSIRPVAIGRKNYLFAGSHEAAQRAAMMYSFFGTCKINNVEPYAWLRDVFERIQEHKANRLEELLPQNWKPLK